MLNCTKFRGGGVFFAPLPPLCSMISILNRVRTNTSKKPMHMLQETMIIFIFKIRHNFFKVPFFLCTIIEWNNLGPTFWNSKSFIFENSVLKFIRPSTSNVFNCDNHKCIGLITRLCLGVSDLREHKFKHNFQDCFNPICSCGLHIESTSPYLLHCPAFNDE